MTGGRDAVDPADPADPLVEPDVAEVRFTVISVDDHLVEPRHLFEGRLPAALADRAPYVRTTSKGHEIWVFDGAGLPQVGLNAVVGRGVQRTTVADGAGALRPDAAGLLGPGAPGWPTWTWPASGRR